MQRLALAPKNFWLRRKTLRLRCAPRIPQTCTHIISCCELRLLAKVLWYPSLLGDVVAGIIVADSIDIGEAMM